MILLIDNYDSFAHNLSRYFVRLGQECRVDRNDAIDPIALRTNPPDAIVISPGPCTPKEAGCSEAIVREFHRTVPILGVCLGHQTIATALGGFLIPALEPIHGRTSEIAHDQKGIFAGLPSPTTVCRYHSLIVDDNQLPQELTITARAADGTPMALAHVEFPVYGVQFHPEAILTEHGYPLLANFLKLAGLPPTELLPTVDDELQLPPPAVLAPTPTPLTF